MGWVVSLCYGVHLVFVLLLLFLLTYFSEFSWDGVLHLIMIAFVDFHGKYLHDVFQPNPTQQNFVNREHRRTGSQHGACCGGGSGARNFFLMPLKLTSLTQNILRASFCR